MKVLELSQRSPVGQWVWFVVYCCGVTMMGAAALALFLVAGR